MRALLTDRNVALIWQFVKYGMCGGIGAVTMFGIVGAVHFFYPGFVSSEVNSQSQLLWNTNIVSTAAFIPSSIVAYILNRAFVFQPGRHKVWVEFWSFMVISLVSYLAGLVGTTVLMRYVEVPSIVGTLAFAIPSVFVNFVCRKYFVFKN